MVKIKFGTDGWRAIIGREYTVDNVIRVAEASSKWMVERGMKKVVIGYDCRFGGKLFSETAARVFASHNITTVLAENFVSTPMVSLGVVKLSADLGVVITASHNPPDYNGFKLKSKLGGPTIPKEISEVEALIPDVVMENLPTLSSLEEDGMVVYEDLEQIYLTHVQSSFDLEAINNAPFKLAYDAMYGAGQSVLPKILPNAVLLHCDYNPSFRGQAPEPIHRNLSELSERIANDDSIGCGLANDGDADRIGMYDGEGNFVDSHRILLLLLYYMYKEKNMTGKVIITFSVTDKMKKLADHFGLSYEVTKIGFKYIAEIMIEEDVLVGGEESGGLAVKGHIPERDGIWIGLVILEFMAKTGKSLSQLLDEIYEIVGPFAFDRDDLHLEEEKKQSIVSKCQADGYQEMGGRAIIRTEKIDGFKYYLSDSEWVMVRPSGTEPVLRVYAQAPDMDGVRTILDGAHKTLLA